MIQRHRELLTMLGVLAVTVSAWYIFSPFLTVIESSAQIPQGIILVKGGFQPGAYDVHGRAYIIRSEGKRILHFEDFKTINGPDLHVYLAFGQGTKDFIDLGQIKATSGSANYEIPSSVDIRKFNTVLIWSEPLRMLFSFAELKTP